MSRLSKSLLAALFVLFLAPGLAHAQTASIVGIVTDATGAVVPETTITARNTATNAVRTAVSNPAGVYSLPNLTPGVYDITVEREGFTPVRFTAVTLTVSQVLTLDVRIEVGAVVQLVEVSGEAVAVLDLATAQVSNLVNQRVISDLPLLLRDPYQLVTLSPGVVVTNSSLGGFAVNGSSERRNNFLLDGTDNNDTSVPGIPSGATALNPDSVEEFRVITNNFSPEFGRNSGAIVDIITKSGANDLHGTLYWFGRYDALAARDFFNQESSSDPFTRNQFGGSVGGPIVKDKTFWFFNTEIQRFATTRTTSSVVPTAAFKAGLVRNPLDGSIIDLNNPADPHNIFGFTPNPLVQSILDSYPDPNGPDVVPGITGLLFFPQKSKQESESYTVKVDHHITPNHTLSGRYTFNQNEDPNPFFAETIPGLDGIDT
ncbi:MAG: carboxypeptidase regulatory-like domain-containing protein, partial [bacterium]